MLENWIRKLSNKVLLVCIVLSVVWSVYGLFQFLTIENGLNLQFGTTFFLLFGLLLVLKHSQLIYENKHVRAMYLIFALLLIGNMMKIQHYAGFSVVFIVCALGFMLVYSHRFITKPHKKIVDILKFAWVLIYFSSVILNNLSVESGNFLLYLGLFAFVLMFTTFCFENKRVIFQ